MIVSLSPLSPPSPSGRQLSSPFTVHRNTPTLPNLFPFHSAFHSYSRCSFPPLSPFPFPASSPEFSSRALFPPFSSFPFYFISRFLLFLRKDSSFSSTLILSYSFLFFPLEIIQLYLFSSFSSSIPITFILLILEPPPPPTPIPGFAEFLLRR